MPVGDDGVPRVEVDGGQLALEVCDDNIIRVAFARDEAFFTRPSSMAAPKRCVAGDARVATNRAELTLRTPRLGVRVERRSGRVSFYDAHGRRILAEKRGGRTLTPTTLYDQPAQSVRQQWLPHPGESLYGLGQRSPPIRSPSMCTREPTGLSRCTRTMGRRMATSAESSLAFPSAGTTPPTR